MTELGTNYIPVAGSDAAAKRKQQLEYQVPAHDLDPNLCDDLTEKEEEQLNQYVNKIKENCVGQGSIVRIGTQNVMKPPVAAVEPNVQRDKLATFLLNSEPIHTLLHSYATIIPNSNFPQILSSPLVPDFQQSPILSDKVKYKLNLMKINSQAIQSGTLNGPFYDEILQKLHSRPVNFQDNYLFKPMDDFRKEYLNNNNFKNNVNQFVGALGDRFLDTIPELDETPYNHGSEAVFKTPQKPTQGNILWNSPLATRAPNSLLREGKLVQQETPMRKAKFPSESDKILADTIQRVHSLPIVFNINPLVPDFEESFFLSPSTKDKLRHMNLNTDTIQSALNNPQDYDQLLSYLDSKGVDYSKDNVLEPIRQLKQAMSADNNFKREVDKFVNNQNTLDNSMKPSRSTDSGFESTPPTPNYSTYPGMVDFNASPGKMMSIPGISDMNMYPQVLSSHAESLPLKDLQIDDRNAVSSHGDKEILDNESFKCHQCKQNINSGEVAVKAERAGKGIAWHPKCFVCFKCNELLADLVYFFHSGNVYCARDLAEILKIPRCHACDELIFTKEYTAAEGATFHIKHFCCYQCDVPLAGQQYLPDDKTNMPLCLPCYNAFHAELCQKCGLVIGPTEQGVAWGKIHWHGTCFVCCGHQCGKSLIGGRFCVKNDQPFCSAGCVKSALAM